MSRFSGHLLIDGWQQASLAAGSVVVLGRGWSGFTASLALASMGCGLIRWIGDPASATGSANSLSRWLLDAGAFPDSQFVEFPTDVVSAAELELAGFGEPDVFLETNGDSTSASMTQSVAERRKKLAVYCGNADGGWIDLAPRVASAQQQAAWLPSQMVLGALMADAARETFFPLYPDVPLDIGGLNMSPVALTREKPHVLVIGAGAIGIYVSLGLAALGFRQTIVDHDVIEESNLSRQGIYAHRLNAPKAIIAHEFVSSLFRGSRSAGLCRKVLEDASAWIAALRPGIIVSAVDNAPARLLLQRIGRELGVPVVQGGTSTFMADCYTQDVDGPLLDEQMHGALLSAANSPREPARRAGGCLGDPIYVVPGIVVAGCVLQRVCQLTELYRGLPPISWGIGGLPISKAMAWPAELEYV